MFLLNAVFLYILLAASIFWRFSCVCHRGAQLQFAGRGWLGQGGTHGPVSTDGRAPQTGGWSGDGNSYNMTHMTRLGGINLDSTRLMGSQSEIPQLYEAVFVFQKLWKIPSKIIAKHLFRFLSKCQEFGSEAKSISERGGGLRCVETMALPHEHGVEATIFKQKICWGQEFVL